MPSSSVLPRRQQLPVDNRQTLRFSCPRLSPFPTVLLLSWSQSGSGCLLGEPCWRCTDSIRIIQGYYSNGSRDSIATMDDHFLFRLLWWCFLGKPVPRRAVSSLFYFSRTAQSFSCSSAPPTTEFDIRRSLHFYSLATVAYYRTPIHRTYYRYATPIRTFGSQHRMNQVSRSNFR